MSFVKLKVLLILSAVNFSEGCDKTLASVITSYAMGQGKPTSLLFYSWCCHSAFNSVSFYRNISRTGIYIASAKGESKLDYREHEILYIADLKCPSSIDHLLTAIKNKMMKAPYRWLIFRDDKLPKELDEDYSRMTNSNILADSNVVIAERNNDSFVLTEVYKLSSSANVSETVVGKLTNGSFTDLREKEHHKRRLNLMGTELVMSNVVVESDQTPRRTLSEDREIPYQDLITRTSWSVARMACKAVNATLGYTFVPSFGYRGKDGNWSGMIRELKDEIATFGTVCLFTPDRFKDVDFITMISDTSLRFVFRQPPLSYVSNIYTLPFSAGVWMSVLVCILSSGVALLLTSKWESKDEKDPTTLKSTIQDIFLFIISAMFQQGCVMEPRNVSGRLMSLILFVALMALYSAYCANIVVLLQAPSEAIQTLHDLYASKITIAAADYEYSRYLFSREKEPLRKAIYEHKLEPAGGKANYYTVDEGVARIRQGQFAFHSMTDSVYRRIERTFLETEKCDLAEIDYTNEREPWLPMQKQSPYKETFKVAFLRVREAGLQSLINRRMKAARPKCSASVAAFTSVGIVEFHPVMLFMLYGFAVALCMWVVEMLHWRFRGQK